LLLIDSFYYYTIFYDRNSGGFLSIAFLGAGYPRALFKCPTNVYNFHDIMMASVELCAK
jgi:hypothetical protein